MAIRIEDFKSCDQIKIEAESHAERAKLVKDNQVNEYLDLVMSAIELSARYGKSYCIVFIPQYMKNTGQDMANIVSSKVMSKGYSMRFLCEVVNPNNTEAEDNILEKIQFSGWEPESI